MCVMVIVCMCVMVCLMSDAVSDCVGGEGRVHEAVGVS